MPVIMNAIWKKHLWLGNSSVDNLYRQKKADGVYNRLLQYSLVQKVLSIDSRINENNGSYSFTTTTIFEINRGSIIDTYELVSTGNLIMVDRNFPKQSTRSSNDKLLRIHFKKTE